MTAILMIILILAGLGCLILLGIHRNDENRKWIVQMFKKITVQNRTKITYLAPSSYWEYIIIICNVGVYSNSISRGRQICHLGCTIFGNIISKVIKRAFS